MLTNCDVVAAVSICRSRCTIKRFTSYAISFGPLQAICSPLVCQNIITKFSRKLLHLFFQHWLSCSNTGLWFQKLRWIQNETGMFIKIMY